MMPKLLGTKVGFNATIAHVLERLTHYKLTVIRKKTVHIDAKSKCRPTVLTQAHSCPRHSIASASADQSC